MRYLLPTLLVSCSLMADDTPAPAASPHVWGGTVKSGITVDWGNTESVDTTSSVRVTRSTTYEDMLDHQWVFSGYHRYKCKNENTSDNEGYLKAAYRQYWAPRWSWVVWEKFEYDAVLDLNFGATTVGGIGYDLIKGERVNLLVETGLGVVHKRYEKKSDNDTYLSGSGGFDLSIKITKDLKFTNVFEYITSLQGFDEYTINNITALLYKFSPCWGIELSHEFDFDNEPPAHKEKLDRKLKGSLVYTF